MNKLLDLGLPTPEKEARLLPHLQFSMGPHVGEDSTTGPSCVTAPLPAEPFDPEDPPRFEMPMTDRDVVGALGRIM